MIRRERPLGISEPSEVKFAAVSRWIPDSANVIINVDIYKISHSILWKDISQSSTSPVWRYLNLFNKDISSDVGMATAITKLTDDLMHAEPVLIIQGTFNQDLRVSEMKAKLAGDGMKIRGEKYKGFTIYSNQDDVKYAFAALDAGIIAVGSVDGLKWVMDGPFTARTSGGLLEGINWAGTVWGIIKPAAGSLSVLPEPWNKISDISLAADVGRDINASITITLADEKASDAMKRALEGFLSLIAIGRFEETKAVSIINNISIVDAGNKLATKVPEEMGLIHLLLQL